MTDPRPSTGPEISIDEELLRCSRCGYCTSVCPTYRVMRTEIAVARGRNELVRQVRDGRMDLGRELRGPLFDCLLCGACTTVCFGGVRTDDVMARARQEWVAAHGHSLVERMAFRDVLVAPQRMRHLMRLLRTAEGTRLPELLDAVGVLGLIHPGLSRANSMVDAMPSRFFRDELARLGFRPHGPSSGGAMRLPGPAGAPRVLYFVGCATNYILPRQGEAAVRLLSLAGCDVTVADNCCCGMPAYAHGDLKGAREAARTNLALLPLSEVDCIVCDCATCGSFLRKWPALAVGGTFDTVATSTRVVDLSEFLAELGTLPRAPRENGSLVTYHDPCHLARGQQIVDHPRSLLTDSGGLTLVEMREADWCCGGGGSYGITHPDVSVAILERKLMRVRETSAHCVATACPGCILQLECGADNSAPFRVAHVSELLCEALGLDLSDWGRRYGRAHG